MFVFFFSINKILLPESTAIKSFIIANFEEGRTSKDTVIRNKLKVDK